MDEVTVVDLEWDGNTLSRDLLVLGIDGLAIPAEHIEHHHKNILGSNTTKLVFTKEDHRWLLEHGFTVRGDIIDVQAMAWCYDERTPLTLDWCVKNYLNRDPDKRLFRKGGKVMFRCDDGEEVLMADAPWDQLAAYNVRDQHNTRDLYWELLDRLTQVGLRDYWYSMHKSFSQVLLKMEMNGLPYDLEAGQELGDELREELDQLHNVLLLEGGLPSEFNMRSRDQIAQYLFTDTFTLKSKVKLPKEEMAKVKKGQWPKGLDTSFNVEKLGREYVHGFYDVPGRDLRAKVKAPKCQAKACGHPRGECLPSVSTKTLKVYHGEDPWVQMFVDYKLNDKALQYVDSWAKAQRGGRLYTHFKQTGTATGRLSSSDPVNLQNIPSKGKLGKRIRGLFRAPDGKIFVDGDYSQIEPRLMAHFSGDPEMTRVFEEGLDLYEEATVSILGKRYPKGSPERQLVKGCFLAMGYEAQPPKIRSNLAEQGFRFPLAAVETAHTDMINLYSVFWDWKESIRDLARELGYITTISGHRRHLDFSGEGAWKAERQAVNSMIQGSAADIVQSLMIKCDRELPTYWKMVLQVHDELLFEVPEFLLRPEHIHDLKAMAESVVKLDVPIIFEPMIVRSWGETK